MRSGSQVRVPQAAKPTDVLDVRGKVWVCLDNGKGGHYLFQEHELPRVLDFRD